MNEIHISEEDRKHLGGMEDMVDTYDSYMRKITFGRERQLRDSTVAMAGVQPGNSVLEIGCATGSLTMAAKRAAGPGGRVCAIDIIPGMIEYSRKKALDAGVDILFQNGSIDNIPFPDSQFDVVMCSFMIFHMSETTRVKGLAEIWRVLKPGGRLFIADLALPRQPVQRFIADKFLGFSQLPELAELLPVLKQKGFDSVETGISDFRIVGISLIGYIRATARKPAA
jgi:ubiquinone/menaquinone biosynthesis C-methylase UbiE